MKGEIKLIWNSSLFAVLLTVLAFVSVGCAADTYTVCSSGCHYISIQAAIDAARPGDTIEVHSGIYYENVNVNKQLFLRGIDTGGGKPVVDAGGDGSAIMISYDGNVLDGFTAMNAGEYPEAGILVTSNNNMVINSTASNNNFTGISLFYSNSNTLTGNIVNSNNYYGICLAYSSNTNTLTGNTANANNDCGILVHGSSNNTLMGNAASNCEKGIHLSSSAHHNTLTGNIVNSNTYNGISLFESSYNTLTSNTANSNNENGIWVSSSSYNTLTSNTASKSDYGIFLESSSNNNILTGNTASNNDWGICLQLSSNDNTLSGNTANSNKLDGIYLDEFSNNNLMYNNYFNNTINAYDRGTNIWNITQTSGTNIVGGSYFGGNYWSDYAGEDTNGDGLGDTERPYNSSGKIVNGGDWLPLVAAPFAPFSLDLVTGLNLISLPLNDTSITTASSLAAKLGPNCSEVIAFNATQQQLQSYVPGVPLNNFAISGGEGYFVNLNNPTLVVLTGTGWSSPFQVSLVSGLNLIGIPVNDTAVTKASTLATKIGANCQEVVNWESGTQSYVSYVTGVPLNDFAIRAGNGYFVTVNDQTEVTFEGSSWEN